MLTTLGFRHFTDMAFLVLVRGLTGTGKSALLSHLIGRNDLNIKKLEIDDMKTKKYGTTTRCDPKVDFQDAGEKAREILKNGFSVAVAEAFCPRTHIDYFLQGAEMNISDPKLLVVRLECSRNTAMERKKGELDPQIIRGQYYRIVEDIENEIVFDTENCSIKEIADKIIKRIK